MKRKTNLKGGEGGEGTVLAPHFFSSLLPLVLVRYAISLSSTTSTTKEDGWGYQGYGFICGWSHANRDLWGRKGKEEEKEYCGIFPTQGCFFLQYILIPYYPTWHHKESGVES